MGSFPRKVSLLVCVRVPEGEAMLSLIVNRILWAIPTLIFVSFISFVIIPAAAGDMSLPMLPSCATLVSTYRGAGSTDA